MTKASRCWLQWKCPAFTEGANERIAKDRIDRNELADKLVETASAAEDPVRALAELILDFVMEQQVEQKIGAAPHERTQERTGYRNGHRERRWDTRLGTLTLQVPKVRQGGYVPTFIEHRKRSEQALIRYLTSSTAGLDRKLSPCRRDDRTTRTVPFLCVVIVRRWDQNGFAEGSGRHQGINLTDNAK